MPFSRSEGTSLRRNGLRGNNEKRSSKAYEKFFEGYKEYKVTAANGKMVTRRVYTGDYMVRRVSDKQDILLKVFYTAFVVLSVVLMCLSSGNPAYTSATRYAEVPIAVCVIVLIFYIRALGNYLISGRKMTLYRYRHSGIPLMRCAWIMAGGYLLGAIAAVVVTLVSGGFTWSAAGRAGSYLLLAVISFLIASKEKRVEYTAEHSSENVPDTVPEENIYTVKNNYDEAVSAGSQNEN